MLAAVLLVDLSFIHTKRPLPAIVEVFTCFQRMDSLVQRLQNIWLLYEWHAQTCRELSSFRLNTTIRFHLCKHV